MKFIGRLEVDDFSNTEFGEILKLERAAGTTRQTSSSRDDRYMEAASRPMTSMLHNQVNWLFHFAWDWSSLSTEKSSVSGKTWYDWSPCRNICKEFVNYMLLGVLAASSGETVSGECIMSNRKVPHQGQSQCKIWVFWLPALCSQVNSSPVI